MATNHQKPSVIILAAGESKRFGSPKGLMSFENKFWIDHQIQTLLNLGFEDCLIILGADADLYRSSSAFLNGQVPQVHAVLNQDYQYGPFSSLRIGIKNMLAGQNTEGAFVLPIDVPVPSVDVIESMLNARNGELKVIAPTFFGQGGHPVWMSPEFMREIANLLPSDPQARLDWQIRNLNSHEVLRLPVNDSKILLNLNYRREFQAAALSVLKSNSTLLTPLGVDYTLH